MYLQKEVYEFISQQLDDPILERRTCDISGQQFPIYQSDVDMYKKLAPTFRVPPEKGGSGAESEAGGFARFQISFPTLCPEERARIRFSRRNVKSFFKRKCDLSGKDIVSLYPANSIYKVYHQDVRYSDQRDPMEYGRDFDMTQAFFPQFDALLKDVPRMALINSNSQNSAYANYIKDGKNCYMTSITYYDCENLSYSVWVMDGKDSTGLLNCRHAELCAECTESNTIFGCYYLHESTSCRDCSFCTNLSNCDHCFLCSNLANHSYCIHNKQYEKDAYHEEMKKIYATNGRHDDAVQTFQTIRDTRIVRATNTVNTTGSIGSNMNNCKNTVFCFMGEETEDCKYVIGEHLTDTMDMTGGTIQLAYQCTNVGLTGSSNMIGCGSVLNSHHMYYCDSCYDGCSFCFGCTGLRGKQYCIFNKQYTEQQRETEVGKIIEKMQETKERGQFFPIAISPFAYNTSRAQEFYPLSKEEATARGYSRHDEDRTIFTGEGYIPKNIQDYDPKIAGEETANKNSKELLQSIIKCSETNRGFRIIPTELDIYIKLHIPIPTTHPDVRYEKRYQRLTEKTLYIRECDTTQTKTISVYPPTAANKVYCNETFDHYVHG